MQSGLISSHTAATLWKVICAHRLTHFVQCVYAVRHCATTDLDVGFPTLACCGLNETSAQMAIWSPSSGFSATFLICRLYTADGNCSFSHSNKLFVLAAW